MTFPASTDIFATLVDWRSTPQSIVNEEHTVITGPYVYLNEVPRLLAPLTSSVTIAISAMTPTEVFSTPQVSGEFQVNYKTGRVTFYDDGTITGKTAQCTYEGMGSAIRAYEFQVLQDAITRIEDWAIAISWPTEKFNATVNVADNKQIDLTEGIIYVKDRTPLTFTATTIDFSSGAYAVSAFDPGESGYYKILALLASPDGTYTVIEGPAQAASTISFDYTSLTYPRCNDMALLWLIRVHNDGVTGVPGSILDLVSADLQDARCVYDTSTHEYDHTTPLTVFPEEDNTKFGVTGGIYTFNGTVKTLVAVADQTPAAGVSAVSYIYVDDANAVGNAASWPSEPHLRLAAVTTNADGEVTAIADYRFQLAFNQEHAFVEPLKPTMGDDKTTWGVNAGVYTFNGTVKTFAGVTAQAVSTGATKYVWIDAANTIGSGAAWTTDPHLKIASITADGADLITALVDYRYTIWNKQEHDYDLPTFTITMNDDLSTFDVAGGMYSWNSTELTFTEVTGTSPSAGTDMYVWINGSGTMVTGAAWPSYIHLKVAKITADGGGIITAIVNYYRNIIYNYATMPPYTDLQVYTNDGLTVDVCCGNYTWEDSEKLYVGASGQVVAANTTNYVWMTSTNTISIATAWPSGKHFKLASVTVDVSGNITDIIDYRHRTMENFSESERKLASVSVDMNTVQFNTLLTVPTGKVFIPTKIIIHTLDADCSAAILTLGRSTAKTDFLGSQTLSGLSAVGKYAILMPVPAATPVALAEYAAAVVFGVDITTGSAGAATATFDVYGYYVW